MLDSKVLQNMGDCYYLGDNVNMGNDTVRRYYDELRLEIVREDSGIIKATLVNFFNGDENTYCFANMTDFRKCTR